MPEQTRPEATSIPNQAANEEKAEGSRQDEGGGITNRPLSEERANQERVPPRGETKQSAESDKRLRPERGAETPSETSGGGAPRALRNEGSHA
jgi:hypothetical protein